MREKSNFLSINVEKLLNEHDDSIESIGSMSLKYNELPNRLESLQVKSKEILNQSQTLFSNVNNAQETLHILINENIGI